MSLFPPLVNLMEEGQDKSVHMGQVPAIPHRVRPSGRAASQHSKYSIIRAKRFVKSHLGENSSICQLSLCFFPITLEKGPEQWYIISKAALAAAGKT
jgi:hypothetical protein